MKLTKAQKAANHILNAAALPIGDDANRYLSAAIAEAIEKAVKEERQACARVATGQWADTTAKHIRARGRK